MPMNKSEIKRTVKEKRQEMETAINAMEEELQKDEEFRKDLVQFHFGRLQTIFQELSKNIEALDGNR